MIREFIVSGNQPASIAKGKNPTYVVMKCTIVALVMPQSVYLKIKSPRKKTTPMSNHKMIEINITVVSVK